MAVVPTVQEFLRRANVAYTVFPHAPAYTAQEEAAVTHIPGRDWAKAVVCFADGEPIQAVVPADLEVDFDRLAVVTEAQTLRLANEDELRWLYPLRTWRHAAARASTGRPFVDGTWPPRIASCSTPAPTPTPSRCATRIETITHPIVGCLRVARLLRDVGCDGQLCQARGVRPTSARHVTAVRQHPRRLTPLLVLDALVVDSTRSAPP